MEMKGCVHAYASVIGDQHSKNNLPCQDYCGIAYYTDENYGIAVVCDGAGSAALAEIGSKKTVELALQVFYTIIQDKNYADNWHLVTEDLWKQTAKEALKEVLKALKTFADANQYDLKALSSTIIVVVYAKGYLFATHIGDGRAGYKNTEGWHALITPFNGEEANETIFLPSTLWQKDDSYIGCKVVTDTTVEAFCMLTDGAEHASFECNVYNEETETYSDPNKPYPGFFDPLVATIKELNSQGKTQVEINCLWEQFLTAGNDKLKHEPDDKTIVLGVNLNN